MKAKKSKKCFNCGVEGHTARACAYSKAPHGEKEACRQRISNITGEEGADGMTKKKIAAVKNELREAEIAEQAMGAEAMNVASELSTKYFRSGTISTLNEVVIYCMLTEEKSGKISKLVMDSFIDVVLVDEWLPIQESLNTNISDVVICLVITFSSQSFLLRPQRSAFY